MARIKKEPEVEPDDEKQVKKTGSSAQGMLDESLLRTRGKGLLTKYSLQGLCMDADGIPELNEFPLEYIPLDGTIVNFGKRRSGKSRLTRYISYAYLQQFFPRGLVISKTEFLNHFYEGFIPKRYIHDQVNTELLQNVLNYQAAIQEDQEEYEAQLAEDEDFDRLFVLLDDVITDPYEIRNNGPLRTMFVNGRHYRVLLLLNTQYPTAIDPTMRDNVDVAFMFNMSSVQTKEHLYACFSDMLPRPLFYALADKYTRDYGSFVYLNGDSTKTSIMDRFFWFKAQDEVPDFRMGTPAFWGERGGDLVYEGYEKAVKDELGM